MKTKSQQSEQERLAPIMAEFLGWEYYTNENGEWCCTSMGIVLPREVIDYFNTPEGFMVVWDKLEERNKDYPFKSWQLLSKVLKEIYLRKIDRYTALYTAIEKMREGEG